MKASDKAAASLMANVIESLRTERAVSSAQALTLVEYAPRVAGMRTERDGGVSTPDDMRAFALRMLEADS